MCFCASILYIVSLPANTGQGTCGAGIHALAFPRTALAFPGTKCNPLGHSA